jgi:hypothetical protein
MPLPGGAEVVDGKKLDLLGGSRQPAEIYAHTRAKIEISSRPAMIVAELADATVAVALDDRAIGTERA